ncbi:MAG: acetyl-CoA carboxylase biotin carboxylase subunit [Actinomycetota bacterium]|nr:acetyl-CoA carboxylase biotin carboxylase subunit [Actinomycetota bacterium]
MLSKVLVANRGEIAVRILRTCRELGITSVAVYSDLDRDSLHVRLADEAYSLGGTTSADSYLDIEKVLGALDRSGADGVHPGYGFLSENAAFAQTITDRGLAFVGPPATAIEIMGNKISAREAAERVGVTGVPGSTDPVTDVEQLRAFAKAHGWPVAVKAVFGGGGRGMKVVSLDEEAEAALESARRESMASFGRDELYLEKYLTTPRHIEVQVLADTHGNVVHLGDRDCSSQRRHQKLVEEAPAPGLPDEIRVAVSEAAVAVAKGCDYENAGTVEFLYQDGEFYYLEMNTRLQVEHPVTEMVTGFDLVEHQLRVASGEPLNFDQDAVTMLGHAIEVRINAEDPTGGRFLPSPGRIDTLTIPDGFGVRFDGGYETGDEVSQFYDNLVGKLVVWGADREAAISRGLRALSELEVVGVATTGPVGTIILNHPDFREVRHSTRWVEESLDLTSLKPVGDGSSGEPVDEEVRRETTVEVNGRRYTVAVWVPETPGSTRPRRTSIASQARGSGSGEVVAPMQGTIVTVLVEAGEAVEIGEAICVLEAMKMENHVAAEKSGIVAEVRVSPGDPVGSGDVLVVIE